MKETLVLSLFLFGFFVALKSSIADEKVNLIFPQVIKARYENCSSDYSRCNFTIWTQAAEYNVVNIDLNNGTTGEIRRSSKWQEPKITNQTVIAGSNQVLVKDMARKAGQWLEDTYNDYKKLMSLPTRDDFTEWSICDASTKFKAGGYYVVICIRDGAMMITDGVSNVKHIEYFAGLFQVSGYAMPISAIMTTGVQKIGNETNFKLIAFDTTGRMIVTSLKLVGPKEIPTIVEKEKFQQLSSIMHPLSNDESKKQWLIKSNLLREHPDDEKALTRDLDMKMQAAYVQTISPIYNVPLKSNELTPLCLSAGYMHYFNSSSRSNIRCYQEGIGLEDFVGKPTLLDRNSLFIPHAYQIVSLQNETHYHLVYSVKLATGDQSMRYIHCRRNEPLKPGIIPVGHDFKVDQYPIYDPGCTVEINLTIAPNDIIEFKHGNCHKLISFYDSLYTIHRLNDSITDVNLPKNLENLSFRINAAFALGNQIYFFTHVNEIIVVNASMDSKCEKLELDMSNARELIGQKFLYTHFLKWPNKEPINEPFLSGYQEFAETNSSMNFADIIPVIICLVVGALIVASIIYLFYCKRRVERVDVGIADSRPKSKIGPAQVDLDLTATIRSKNLSNTGIQSFKTVPQSQSQSATQAPPQPSSQSLSPTPSQASSQPASQPAPKPDQSKISHSGPKSNKPKSATKPKSSKSLAKSRGRSRSKSKPGKTMNSHEFKRKSLSSPKPANSIKSAQSVKSSIVKSSPKA